MRKLIIKRKSFVVQYAVDVVAEGPPTKRGRHGCPECRREFRSAKALHGHMRVHPAKGYRGVSRPAKNAPIKIDDDDDDVLHQEVDAEVIAAAETMMMLKREDERAAAARPAPAYHCGACDKWFDTHQALGGHVASHNKQRRIGSGPASEAPGGEESGPAGPAPQQQHVAVHECDVCGKAFDKGVSLGGHKRKHFLERERAKESGAVEPPPTATPATTTSRPFYLDLNVIPDDESGN